MRHNLIAGMKKVHNPFNLVEFRQVHKGFNFNHFFSVIIKMAQGRNNNYIRIAFKAKPSLYNYKSSLPLRQSNHP